MISTTASQRMLAKAIELFRKNGIHQTGVERIIAESNSARGTLYHSFGSKSGLIAAAMEEEGKRWRQWFFEAIERRGKTPRQQLICIFDVLESWFREDEFSGCLFMNAVAECRNQDEVILEATLSHKREVNRKIARIARAAGAKHPRRLTQQLDLLIDGLIITALVTRSPAGVSHGRRAAELLIQSAIEPETT